MIQFPLSCSDNALYNTSFRKGYDYCRRILCFSHNEGIIGKKISECFKTFEQTTDNSKGQGYLFNYFLNASLKARS